MENKAFKLRLITKLSLGGVFTVLTVAACVSISLVNKNDIAPNEGFITNALCKVIPA